MRKALCVGIDYYENANSLGFCVSDANSMAEVLASHADGSTNFDVRTLLTGYKMQRRLVDIDPDTHKPIYIEEPVGVPVTCKKLKSEVEKLFAPDKYLEVALFYFAGHGYVDDNGGYLLASDIDDPDDGLSLDYLMRLVKNSKAMNRIIILDSCHSGVVANIDKMSNYCILPENTIIMSACTEAGVARDGCFTPLMVDALKGGAMNLLGEVSPGSVHSYIDRALRAWDQRPVLKANIENSVCLRKNKPPIDIDSLKKITSVFPEIDKDLQLDPGYEEDKRDAPPEYMEHDLEKERIMKLLRTYTAINLVVPVGTEYMYWAAIKFKSCRLTALGKYFWQLVKDNKI